MTEIMFADSLLSARPETTRRGWTTFTSFALQAVVVGLLLTLPLLRPIGLPALRQISTPISLGQPLPEQPAVRPHGGSSFAANHPFVFRQPTEIPHGFQPSADDTPPQIMGSGSYISSAVPSDPNALNLFNSGSGTRPVLPPPPAVVHRPLLVSHMSDGDLIRKVQPTYPALARTARIQGTVLLQAVISKQGVIENLKLVSGHPMLSSAAIDAVRQWRYRPYILNGEPVEVETEITVNFSLNGN